MQPYRVLLVIVVAATLLACSNGSSHRSSAIGVIQELGMEDGKLITLTLKDDSGRLSVFSVARNRPLNVDVEHLEVHRESFWPVILRLENVHGVELVVAIDDY